MKKETVGRAGAGIVEALPPTEKEDRIRVPLGPDALKKGAM
jgi:hypothetical protein